MGIHEAILMSELETLMNTIIMFGVFTTMQAIVLMMFIWLFRKRKVWPLIRLGIAGHGNLAIVENPAREVEFILSKKPIMKVNHEFLEKGTNKLIKVAQPVRRVWHTLKGTSIPIHFCPHNTATNVCLSDVESKSINPIETNLGFGLAYTQGRIDEKNLLPKASGFQFKKEWLMYAAILIIILIVAWNYLGSQGAPAV